jgi:drug/metabolite transporter (DMT)-like permease
MLAILGGFGAALAFATATLCNSRASRMIGPTTLLAWVMLLGLALVGPLAAIEGTPDGLDREAVLLLAVAALGNVAGLLLAYAGLRIGKVGIVGPVISTQGAIAAVIAVLAGEALAPGAGVLLAVIAVGIFLAAGSSEGGASEGDARAALYALGGAACFGASLYATGKVSADLPVPWALLPARLLGTVLVTLPVIATSRLRMTRAALPLVLVSAVCEVAGFALFALGARHGIATSAVLASQFGAIAAVAAYILFRERLASVQRAGVVVIVVGVGALTAVQA